MLKNSKKYINLLQVLLETKTHIGHKKTDWVPKIAPYILAEYKGLYLLNLEYTIPLLKKALGVFFNIYSKNKNILIIGNSNTNRSYVAELVKRNNIYGLYTKWVGGSLSNWNPRHFKYTQVNFKEPSLIVLLNVKGNENVIKEATKKSIPVMAILDTDIDPKGIQYPIPGNDDSPQAQYLYYKLILNILKK
jgi:small subunit ribosomal protein S2